MSTKLEQLYHALLSVGVDKQKVELLHPYHMILNEHHIVQSDGKVVVDDMYHLEVTTEYIQNAAGNVWRLCK